jgi:lipopolysaccharide/colanic/teichoic acid biosynthesis glycosyltransferase
VKTKRIFDISVALIAVVLSSPIWVVAAVLVKLSSRGPMLHRAVRAGKDGVPFTLLKFRTMSVAGGPAITTSDDPRITRVGKLLRRFKIDELPQLVNVLRGEMSLVGPRPEDPRYVERYTPEQRRLLSVPPGMTSPASIAYRDEERYVRSFPGDVETAYLEKVLPAKLAVDLEYIDKRSLWTDLRILARTGLNLVTSPRR